jgi:hypothetical protein
MERLARLFVTAMRLEDIEAAVSQDSSALVGVNLDEADRAFIV